MKYKETLFIALITLLLFSPAYALEKVRLQLKWKHQFQFAGYYAAQHLGFYREVGLDVEILEVSPGMDAIDVVLNGGAEYGIGNSGILLKRAEGKPLVVLAVIMQHSPFILLTRQESTLNGLQDLSGKRLMLEPMADEIIAFLNHEGLPLERLETVVDDTHNLNAFIAGEVDAMDAYITDEPYRLMRQGIPFNVFNPRAAGIEFYGDNLFTTENEIANHPERVRRFREASIRGWRYAMAHPQEIIDLILTRYRSDIDRDLLTFEAQKMQQLMHPELIDIGYMHPDRWHRIGETYASLGMLPDDIPLDGFLYNAKRPLDLFWFYVIISAALIVLSMAIVINIRFSRLNQQLTDLIHLKTHFANIGETVNNISHQWKQPLNELAVQLMILERVASDETLPENARKEIRNATLKSHHLIEFMAKTVDSFRHLLSTGHEIREFAPKAVVEEVIDFIQDTFRLHKISLQYHAKEDVQLRGKLH